MTIVQRMQDVLDATAVPMRLKDLAAQSGTPYRSAVREIQRDRERADGKLVRVRFGWYGLRRWKIDGPQTYNPQRGSKIVVDLLAECEVLRRLIAGMRRLRQREMVLLADAERRLEAA